MQSMPLLKSCLSYFEECALTTDVDYLLMAKPDALSHSAIRSELGNCSVIVASEEFEAFVYRTLADNVQGLLDRGIRCSDSGSSESRLRFQWTARGMID